MKHCHRYEFGKVKETICDLLLFGEISKVCQKSPPNKIDIPPNNLLSHSSISLNERSKHSKQRLSIIEASSHMTIVVCSKRVANKLFFLMSHVDLSYMSIGMLNLE